MLYFGAFVLSYLVFVFLSENTNPFSKPKAFRSGYRWRFGRRMGLAFLLASFIGLALNQFSTLSSIIVLAVAVGVLLILAVPPFVKFSTAFGMGSESSGRIGNR